MKTKIYLFGCVVLCLVLSAGIMSSRGGSAAKDIIIIRATQDMLEKDSRICVFRGNAQIEKLQLGKWQRNEEDNNYDKITTAIKKYGQMGYEVTNAFEVADGSKTLLSTFILEKN